MPVLDIAHVRQCAAHKPCEQAPAYCPNDEEEAIHCQVEAWIQADTAVQDNRE